MSGMGQRWHISAPERWLPFDGYHTYVHRDTAGAALYVGMSGSLQQRTGDHRRKSRWWNLVDFIDYQLHPDPVRGHIAEIELIHSLNPTHNIHRQRIPSGYPTIPEAQHADLIAAVAKARITSDYNDAIAVARRLYLDGWGYGSIGQAVGNTERFGRVLVIGIHAVAWSGKSPDYAWLRKARRIHEVTRRRPGQGARTDLAAR